jgi:replicative DNA helicase
MIKIDRHTVIQILGSLMNKPELMSDVDRYIIEVGDFPNTLDKLIFSAINNLYNDGDGANKIKTVDIINYLNDNQIAKNLIEKENGETFIKDCEMNSEPANFNHYYNRLKKLNLLKDLEKTGRDITEFYCEDILNPNYV